ncbi:sigma-54 interaction domain-containing protein [Marinisporobacter balticus]|uniref:Transcriptional regulator with PAS, ATPase and Fis domain n=1 Tax=Marinisporobacter balticus TaxID=2018667 RepID=A0A4R2KSN8_9FIRM|nr:sigma 54-interacting transcriptional regulator [Marinisporobacter balticus]TCO77381.1 transcriptional regulator with PAS, ATPase and Fis domain [Marinisporobacter balticus]
MNRIHNDFLDKLYNPVIVCNNSGKILHTNVIMDNVFEYINVKKPQNIQDLDADFNFQEIIKNEPLIRTIKFKDLNSRVNIYCIKNNSNETNILYLFDKSILDSKTIDNVIEHIDDVVVIFNEYGVIEKMNPICDDILPFKRSEAIGNSIYEISKKGLVHNPILIDMLKSKKKLHRNVIYPNGKGIAYTASPSFHSNGNLKGGVLTGRDITRLIKLASQMKFDTQQPEAIEYISKSIIMENIKQMVIRAASSDSYIFINGESGVGKEIIAKTIYRYSQRRDKPFVSINCGAIPTELLESEFFGYEEGAFTGAKKGGRKGLLEEANGGTVFLDEIGELPMHMQTKLLRVIQENTITRIGGNTPIHVDIRYISATNVPDAELHTRKKFRQDLYYRLSVIPIKIPPLRSRTEDILPLIEYFLEFYNKKYNRKLKISSTAMNLLHDYNWPGNIRELKNMIERFVVLSTKDVVREDEFNILINLDTINTSPADTQPSVIISGYTNLNTVYRVVDQMMIPKAIRKYGSINRASEALGINQSTIHRKIKSGHIQL